MLTSLKLKNFTVFPEATFDFGKHLNVIVGENGAGKTHVLKVLYSVLAVSARGEKETGGNGPTKTYLQKAVASKLQGVFRPDDLGRLARRQATRSRGEVECYFNDAQQNLSFSLNSTSKSEVTIDLLPSAWGTAVPVYFPTRELLTIAPGFVALYETTHLPFEETWKDTALLLQSPLAKGPREKAIKTLLEPLETAMAGTVHTDSAGRFYLKTKSGEIEMHLVAEGMRKLAMVARLIASGTLLDKGFLFWDEPEANLNPKTIKSIARTILEISQSGVQVFIATHSLFLLRELYILQQNEFATLDARCFGLHLAKNGAATVQSGKTMDDIGDITALDEDMLQSVRYLEAEERLANGR